MARELIQEHDPFANDLRKVDEYLAKLPDPYEIVYVCRWLSGTSVEH